jgi:hypothetical protein
MNKQRVNVVEIKDAPKLKYPAVIQQGIRDKASAEKWGMKNGFPTVYFMSKRQKVYAERLQTRVDHIAQAIEEASADLVAVAEAAL